MVHFIWTLDHTSANKWQGSFIIELHIGCAYCQVYMHMCVYMCVDGYIHVCEM